MAKFDDLWPETQLQECPIEAYGITREEYKKMLEGNHKFRLAHYLKGQTLSPCFICGEKTHWIEINFEGYCCSEECDDKAWNEYFEAVKNAPR